MSFPSDNFASADAFRQEVDGVDIGKPKFALLIGAGFTKSFGGWLATEFWERLVSSTSIRRLDYAREALLTQENIFDFETALTTVRNGRSLDDYLDFLTSVAEIFCEQEHQIDENLKAMGPDVVGERLSRFLSLFAGEAGDPGSGTSYLFSLNQDLFFERHRKLYAPGDGHADYWWPWVMRLNPNEAVSISRPDPNPVPSYRPEPEDFKGRFSLEPPAPLVRVPVDGPEKDYGNRSLDRIRGRQNIFKLHGSLGWYQELPQSTNHRTAQGMMVLGREKQGHITNTRLLSWYWRTFERVCQTDGIQIMVIGYSFGDEHVNKVLDNAAKKGRKNGELGGVGIIDPKLDRLLTCANPPFRQFLEASKLIFASSRTFLDCLRDESELARIKRDFFGT